LQDVEHLRLDGDEIGSAPQFPTISVKRIIFEKVNHLPARAARPFQPARRQNQQNLNDKSMASPSRALPLDDSIVYGRALAGDSYASQALRYRYYVRASHLGGTASAGASSSTATIGTRIDEPLQIQGSRRKWIL
jgi:hypothetical protein